MKDKMNWLGIVGVFIGMAASRRIGNYYGVNGRVIVGFCDLMAVLALVLYLILRQYRLGLLIMLLIIIPPSISLGGMYLENETMVIGGFVLFFLTVPILIKFTNNIEKNKKLKNNLNG